VARLPDFGATVTVLVADIESSTALSERLGRTRWLALLAEYEALLRERLALYGGREIKAMGDGHIVEARASGRSGARPRSMR
jgi:class 3 adenylate cyclase